MCAAVALGGAPLNAAEVIRYPIVMVSGTSVFAVVATRSHLPPPGGLEEGVIRTDHMAGSGMRVTALSWRDDPQQDLPIIYGGAEGQGLVVGTPPENQLAPHPGADRHLRDPEVTKTVKVSAKKDDNLTPIMPNVTPRLPNATPRLPNIAPQLPNTVPQLPDMTPRLHNVTPRLPTITPPESGRNPEVPTFQPPMSVPAAGAADDSQARMAYQQAINMLRAGQYGQAITTLQQFMNNYPHGPHADSAQYWLGEAQYLTRQFPAALKDFQRVVGQYPDSPKAPYARLRIGFTYYEMGKWNDARKALNGVMQLYPDTPAARLAENRLQKMGEEGH